MFLAIDHHPEYALIVASNRDEFVDRPTEAAHQWGSPTMIAGRDIRAGGTWLGAAVHSPRWGAVTNVAGSQAPLDVGAKSRGTIVGEWVGSMPGTAPDEWAAAAAPAMANMAGFNALVGDVHEGQARVCHVTNRGAKSLSNLGSGCHCLSNGRSLETGMRFERGRRLMEEAWRGSGEARSREGGDALASRLVEGLMKNSEWFLERAPYCTRTSAVLLVDRQGRVSFFERDHLAALPQRCITSSWPAAIRRSRKLRPSIDVGDQAGAPRSAHAPAVTSQRLASYIVDGTCSAAAVWRVRHVLDPCSLDFVALRVHAAPDPRTEVINTLAPGDVAQSRTLASPPTAAGWIELIGSSAAPQSAGWVRLRHPLTNEHMLEPEASPPSSAPVRAQVAGSAQVSSLWTHASSLPALQPPVTVEALRARFFRWQRQAAWRQLPGVCRVWATSDLHLENKENMQAVGAWEGYNEDALIVAGDVCTSLELLRHALTLLRAKFRHVFLCAGNHELWRARDDPPSCAANLEKLVAVYELATSLGVHAAPAMLGEDGDPGALCIVPLQSWYHRGFLGRGGGGGGDDTSGNSGGGRGRSADDAEHDAEPPQARFMDVQCAWPDALGGRSTSPMLAPFLASLNEHVIAHVLQSRARGADRRPLITCSHFLPRPELHRGYAWLGEVEGSHELGAQVERLAPDVHIFGHTHWCIDMTLGPTRFVQHPLGYPRERRADAYRLGAAKSFPLALCWERGVGVSASRDDPSNSYAGMVF